MTHTTGPWQTVKVDGSDDCYHLDVKTLNGALVASVSGGMFHHGNAQLIAAAPDLLDALAALNEYFSNFSQDSLGHKKLGIARAALAKATGGSQ